MLESDFERLRNEGLLPKPSEKPLPPAQDAFLACFKSLDAFSEEQAEWLIRDWLPAGQPCLLSADGGTGKTSFSCHLLAAISSGQPCILDPPGYVRQPQRVALLTTEDSIRKKLKKKLRLAGANMQNIIAPDFLADKSGLLRGLKFGSNEIERFIRHFRPALCVFDPVQGFIPASVNMSSRNAMRDCLAPLVALGEEVGTCFLIICHTNKRKGASGRDRIADSADLWDISRSVLMMGYTESQGIRYLSNEKNNYTSLQETVLFSINGDGQVQSEGRSWKRDRDFMAEAATASSAPKRDDCKEWVLAELDAAGGLISSEKLQNKAELAGFSFATLRRAKEELKKSGIAKSVQKNREWFIQRLEPWNFDEWG